VSKTQIEEWGLPDYLQQ